MTYSETQWYNQPKKNTFHSGIGRSSKPMPQIAVPYCHVGWRLKRQDPALRSAVQGSGGYCFPLFVYHISTFKNIWTNLSGEEWTDHTTICPKQTHCDIRPVWVRKGSWYSFRPSQKGSSYSSLVSQISHTKEYLRESCLNSFSGRSAPFLAAWTSTWADALYTLHTLHMMRPGYKL